jgi:hypothetical protein
MRGFRFLMVAAVTAVCFTAALPKAQAQVSVQIGPYDCAPSGYYGPEWFTGDVFVGAGPWFHGKTEFRGNVNNSFDPQKGYKGPKPNRGEKAEPTKRVDSTHFKGNEERDGRGHASEPKSEAKH